MVTTLFGKYWMIGLILATSLALPGPASAAWLGFRNDLPYAVIIQSTCGAGGAPRSAPQYLYPGEVIWNGLAPNTSRQITIFDTRSPRPVLERFEIILNAQDEMLCVLQPRPGYGDRVIQVIKTRVPPQKRKCPGP